MSYDDLDDLLEANDEMRSEIAALKIEIARLQRVNSELAEINRNEDETYARGVEEGARAAFEITIRDKSDLLVALDKEAYIQELIENDMAKFRARRAEGEKNGN